MTLRQELQKAVKEARHEDGSRGQVTLSNGWTVEVTSVRITPRGGPCRAWKHLYYLIVPPNTSLSSSPRTWGGYDSAASFVVWAANFIPKHNARMAEAK